MKRDKFLVSLSHDHHHGLIVARQLSKDYKDPAGNNLAPEIKKERLLKFFDANLKGHFKEEENIFKIVKGLDKRLDEQIIDTIQEHIRIKELIFSLQKSEDVILLDEIGTLLKEHIRKEERVLFPLIEEKITDEIINEIISSR